MSDTSADQHAADIHGDQPDPFALIPTPATMVDLLCSRAERQADQLGHSFLLDGEEEEVSMTYGDLDRRARAIGASLQSKGAASGRVLLIYPPGLEYIAAFFGCLYAGAIAVPAYPPRPNRPMDRLQSMLMDSQSRFVLTTSQVYSQMRAYFAQVPALKMLTWVATDEISDQDAGGWSAPAVDGDTLAFLQYTSGSTAEPKGVMISHANLLRNLAHIYRSYRHTPESQGVIWLPPYHDMGLIGGILQPLYGGFPVALMSPVHFLQRPLRWLRAVTRYQATTSGGPNFAFDLCLRKIPPERREGLDLGSWNIAFNGAETIRARTIDAFSESFAPWGFRREAFYPCYGLAEATLIVSGAQRQALPAVRRFESAGLEKRRAVVAAGEADGTQTLVGSGGELIGETIVIVEPETSKQLKPGEIGEIWVAGPSVGQGYWGRTEDTERTFRAYLSDGDGPYLRTGDLGFLHDGELFVTGRLRDLIIIRGANYHPQDIELTVEHSHPGLRPGCSAAFTLEAEADEYLAIVAEIEHPRRRAPDVDGTIKAIRQAVSRGHDLQVTGVQLLKTGSIPKTSSGKIRRHACQAGFANGSLQIAGEWIGPALRTVREPQSDEAQTVEVAE